MKHMKWSVPVVAIAILAANPWQARAAQDGHHSALYQRLCARENDASRHNKIGERLARELGLSDAQKAAYAEFQQVRLKSLDDAKTRLCTKEPDLSSFEERLAFSQSFLEARVDAMKAENPKLIAFYNTLDDKQKRKFDSFRNHMATE